jgi:dienelactone hydrolase
VKAARFDFPTANGERVLTKRPGGPGRFLIAIAFATAAAFHGGAFAATPPPERVSFDSLDRQGGAPVRITGLLFRPEDGGDGRHPAVVALHGCGGMYGTVASQRDALSLRHRAMAELLVAEGYIVLFPDSFRPRGRDEICTVENARRTIRETQRRLDAQGALLFLQARVDVAPDRVAVLGWSHGGSAVLATLNAKQPAVVTWRDRGSPPYFRAGVAFYPGCVESLRARGGYAAAAPLTLFIAGADDWTAPGPCVDLAVKLALAGEPVTHVVYPDTYHGFDGPVAQGQVRLQVPNGVHPGGGVTLAPNPVAREDAYARLKAFLRAQLGEPARMASSLPATVASGD